MQCAYLSSFQELKVDVSKGAKVLEVQRRLRQLCLRGQRAESQPL
jgi:hypothetical protein